MPKIPELQPGNEWEPCLCREIHPTDRPCIVCEAWGYFEQEPPPEVDALFGDVPPEEDKFSSEQ